MVSHPLLPCKLGLLNIDTDILAWIEGYLSQQQLCAVLNIAKYGYRWATAIVLQGSVLRPLMFLNNINDIVVGIISIKIVCGRLHSRCMNVQMLCRILHSYRSTCYLLGSVALIAKLI